MKLGKIAAVVLVAALVMAAGSLNFPGDSSPEPTPEDVRQTSGEDLWQSLPPELLSNVAESIEEQISDLRDDLERVQEIQREKLAAATPAPYTPPAGAGYDS